MMEKNRIKLLFCKLEQFLGLVETFAQERFSEVGHFVHFRCHVFWSMLVTKFSFISELL